MNNKYPDYFTMADRDITSTLRDPGARGEMQLYNYLHAHFPNNLLIPNIYIEWDKGKTSEIDLCMLTHKYLFVFEYKNYSVPVYGNESYKQWIYYNSKGEARRFRSPILQNQGHVLSLKRLCPYFPETRIAPVVVFSNRARVNVTSRSPVLHKSQLPDYINHLHLYCDSGLVFPVIEKLAVDLASRSKQPDLIKEQHINYIKSCHFE